MVAENKNSSVKGPADSSKDLGCGLLIGLVLVGAIAGLWFAAHLQGDFGFSFGWAGLGGLALWVLIMIVGTVITSLIFSAPDRIIGVTGVVSGVQEHGQEPRFGFPGSVTAFKSGSVRIGYKNKTREELRANSRLKLSVSFFESETEGIESFYCLYISDASDDTLEEKKWFSFYGNEYSCIAIKMSIADGKHAARIVREFNGENVSDELRASKPVPRFVNTPRAAEELAADWIEWMGWGEVSLTADTRDGGIDVIGKSPVLGRAVAQVKLEGRPTGRPALQSLRGAAVSENASHWMFFSAAGYTRAAVEWADQVDMGIFQFARDGQINPINEQARHYYENAQM